MLPPKPFEVIALSLSGGGYRAAAFHLGTMTYLDMVQFEDRSLLERVKVLSTVSGGTFTGVKYAVNVQQGKGIRECYREMYRFMKDVPLVDTALGNLSAKTWNRYKTRNIINAFSEVYFNELTGETFGTLMKGDLNHLEEISFNSTDFSNGLYFRFQKTSGNKGLFGNGYHHFDIEMVKEIRLADIIASSSCFPAGFEPISFPADFRNDKAENFNAYAKKLLKDHPGDFPIYLMDGGVYDNQGINSVLMANERMKKIPDYQGKQNPIDLYFISDVSSPFLDPLVIKTSPEKGWLSWISFARLENLGGLALLLTLASALSLIVWQCKGVVIFYSLLGTLLLLISILFLFFGNLMIRYVPKWFHVPVYFMKPLEFFNRMHFSTYKNMIVSRVESVMKMVSDVFMKQIRRLSYDRVYNDPVWNDRLIMNAVHELIPVSIVKRVKKPDIQLPDEILHPGKRIEHIATNAHEMGTTLWFTPEQLAGEENTLDSLIACGQFTACFNLLEYIEKLRAENDYKNYPEPLKEEINRMYTAIWEDWTEFKKNPFWFKNKFYPGNG